MPSLPVGPEPQSPNINSELNTLIQFKTNQTLQLETIEAALAVTHGPL